MYTSAVLLRRSRSLIILIGSDGLYASNFICKSEARLSPLSIQILLLASQWTYPSAFVLRLADAFPPISIATEVVRLIDAGLLILFASETARRDEEFERDFSWGPAAGFYHFTIKNTVYTPPTAFSRWLEYRVATKPRVPLYHTNQQYAEIVPLPPFDDSISPFSTMRQRRSFRGFSLDAVSLNQVRDCLFSGMGIVGFVETPLPGEGPLPLTMTPSGGARNPYEAFLYARNVAGLKRGIYHYSAVDNTLGLVQDEYTPEVGVLLAGQPWFDNAAAVFLLVAYFERMMWKYPHPTGYRVVMLEAGHIAQNMLLAATANELVAAPTCAIDDTVVERLLRLHSLTTTVTYTVSIGRNSGVPTTADVPAILPNPFLLDSRAA